MNYVNNKKASTFLRVLGIVVLLLVVLSSTASADTVTGKIIEITWLSDLSSATIVVQDSNLESHDYKGVPPDVANKLHLRDKVTVEDKNGKITITMNGGTVPEFPSYATPVVAILGIFAIIGRRKNN